MTDLVGEQLALRASIESGEARRIRERAGLSAVTIARHLDVSPAAVTRWEQGARYPRGANAVKYARLLRRLASQVPA